MIEVRPVHRGIRGTKVSLFVEVYQDDDSDIDGTETVRAVAKAVTNPQDRSPGDAAADALVFQTVYVAASGEQLAGWQIEAGAADTAALSAGFYLVDVRIDMGSGQVAQTVPLALDLRERVTEAA